MSRIRIGLALLTSGVLLLTGCGRSTDDDAPAKAGTIGTGPATWTLTMWAQGAEAEQLPGLLKQFEAANPGVHVNVTAIPWPSAHDKYQAAIAAGTTPDIAQIGTTWMGEFAASGSVAQLPGDFGAAEFYGGAVKSTQVRGNTYGVPWYVDTPVLYYRTDLAAAAGFSAPPANWNDLKTMAKAMQTRAGAKYGIGLAPKDFQGFLPFAWSNGAGLTNPDGSKWTINTPQLVDAVRFYQSFFTEGIASKTPSTDAGAYISAFVDGSVPMFFGGPFEVSQINKAGGAGFGAKYATAVRPQQDRYLLRRRRRPRGVQQVLSPPRH
jgi:multiple sugar transport system substrate-binding protein